jgi:hypothetical protein
MVKRGTRKAQRYSKKKGVVNNRFRYNKKTRVINKTRHRKKTKMANGGSGIEEFLKKKGMTIIDEYEKYEKYKVFIYKYFKVNIKNCIIEDSASLNELRNKKYEFLKVNNYAYDYNFKKDPQGVLKKEKEKYRNNKLIELGIANEKEEDLSDNDEENDEGRTYFKRTGDFIKKGIKSIISKTRKKELKKEKETDMDQIKAIERLNKIEGDMKKFDPNNKRCLNNKRYDFLEDYHDEDHNKYTSFIKPKVEELCFNQLFNKEEFIQLYDLQNCTNYLMEKKFIFHFPIIEEKTDVIEDPLAYYIKKKFGDKTYIFYPNCKKNNNTVKNFLKEHEVKWYQLEMNYCDPNCKSDSKEHITLVKKEKDKECETKKNKIPMFSKEKPEPFTEEIILCGGGSFKTTERPSDDIRKISKSLLVNDNNSLDTTFNDYPLDDSLDNCKKHFFLHLDDSTEPGQFYLGFGSKHEVEDKIKHKKNMCSRIKIEFEEYINKEDIRFVPSNDPSNYKTLFERENDFKPEKKRFVIKIESKGVSYTSFDEATYDKKEIEEIEPEKYKKKLILENNKIFNANKGILDAHKTENEKKLLRTTDDNEIFIHGSIDTPAREEEYLEYNAFIKSLPVEELKEEKIEKCKEYYKKSASKKRYNKLDKSDTDSGHYILYSLNPDEIETLKENIIEADSIKFKENYNKEDYSRVAKAKIISDFLEREFKKKYDENLNDSDGEYVSLIRYLIRIRELIKENNDDDDIYKGEGDGGPDFKYEKTKHGIFKKYFNNEKTAVELLTSSLKLIFDITGRNYVFVDLIKENEIKINYNWNLKEYKSKLMLPEDSKYYHKYLFNADMYNDKSLTECEKEYSKYITKFNNSYKKKYEKYKKKLIQKWEESYDYGGYEGHLKYLSSIGEDITNPDIYQEIFTRFRKPKHSDDYYLECKLKRITFNNYKKYEMFLKQIKYGIPYKKPDYEEPNYLTFEAWSYGHNKKQKNQSIKDMFRNKPQNTSSNDDDNCRQAFIQNKYPNSSFLSSTEARHFTPFYKEVTNYNKNVPKSDETDT